MTLSACHVSQRLFSPVRVAPAAFSKDHLKSPSSFLDPYRVLTRCSLCLPLASPPDWPDRLLRQGFSGSGWREAGSVWWIVGDGVLVRWHMAFRACFDCGQRRGRHWPLAFAFDHRAHCCPIPALEQITFFSTFPNSVLQVTLVFWLLLATLHPPRS